MKSDTTKDDRAEIDNAGARSPTNPRPPNFQPTPGLEQAVPTNMQTLLTKIIEEMHQRAKVCETAAQDSTEQALTGESSEKEKHTQDAKDWTIKSKFWLEAEGVVRAMAEPPSPDVPEPAPLRPVTCI